MFVFMFIFIIVIILQYGNSALHFACLKGHLHVVKYLLPIFGRRKFDVNIFGEDCLTLARREGRNDIVKYLISEGGFGSRGNI